MTPSKKELLDAYKTLRRSRRLIEHNWISGFFGRSQGRTYNDTDTYEGADEVCSIGALAKVKGTTGRRVCRENPVSSKFLSCAIDKTTGQLGSFSPYDNIVHYNDKIANGKKDVLAVWDEAIKLARGAAAAAIRGPEDEKGS